MMQRALTQGKVTKESQLRLHLEILRRQRAASAALELLREHGGLLGMAEEKQRAQAELHEQLGQFSEAADLHAAMLTDDADDWAAHRGRLRCVVRADLDDAERRAAADVVAAALTELEEKNPRRRALASRASASPPATSPTPDAATAAAAGGDSGALVALLAEYFEAFCHKESCYLDVSAHLAALPPAAAADLCERIRAAPAAAGGGGGGGGRRAADARGLRRAICTREWEVGCGASASWSADDRSKAAAEWMGMYVRHRPLSAELDERERHHGDMLPLLAAEVLVGLPVSDWFAKGSGVRRAPYGPLLSAAAYLHVGREASPHNFQLTLALVQCHAALGSVHEATRLYHALGVKHIQQDSLSHLILPPLLRCGALEQAATVLNPAQRFAKDGLRDMPDSLQLAFSSDNYVEALEFVQFEGHLEASWWRRLVVVAAIVHQLPLRLRTAPSQPQPPADALQTALDATTALDGDVSAAALAALPDTLDTTVHESHLPSENAKAVAWMRDVWLARRVLLLRVVRACLGGDDDALAAAEVALREACGRARGGGGGSGGRGGRRRRRGGGGRGGGGGLGERALHRARRRPLRPARRDRSARSHRGGGGRARHVARRRVRAAAEALRRGGGYAPAALVALAQTALLALPLLCALMPLVGDAREGVVAKEEEGR